jgi:molecular chaperone HscC
VIVDEDDKRSQKDIAAAQAKLEKLKVHPRDEAENVALLTRAERAYEGFIGPQRDYIGHFLLDYKGALEKQDKRLIADAREKLAQLLDELEANPPV